MSRLDRAKQFAPFSALSGLEEAIEESYKKVERITFKGAYYRHDIGKRALAAYEE